MQSIEWGRWQGHGINCGAALHPETEFWTASSGGLTSWVGSPSRVSDCVDATMWRAHYLPGKTYCFSHTWARKEYKSNEILYMYLIHGIQYYVFFLEVLIVSAVSRYIHHVRGSKHMHCCWNKSVFSVRENKMKQTILTMFKLMFMMGQHLPWLG